MKVTFEELKDFLEVQFPQGAAYGSLEALGDGWAEMTLAVEDDHLRPGGTVSGPAMMAQCTQPCSAGLAWCRWR